MIDSTPFDWSPRSQGEVAHYGYCWMIEACEAAVAAESGGFQSYVGRAVGRQIEEEVLCWKDFHWQGVLAQLLS